MDNKQMLEVETCLPIREHAEQILRWRNDPNTLSMFYHQTPKVESEFWQEYQTDYFRDPQVLPIFVKEDGERVAFLRFNRVPTVASDLVSYDISINTDPNQRGKSIGTRALQAACEYVRTRGVEEIVAEIKVENIASIRTFEKAGFKRIGEGDKYIADIETTYRIYTYNFMVSDRREPKKALLIDLDGTLANSLPVMREVYDLFLTSYGKVGSDIEFNSLNGPSLDELPEILKVRHGIQDSIENLKTKYRELVIKNYSKARPSVGGIELLKYAFENSWTCALVTANWESVARAWLAHHGLLQYFSLVVGSEVVLRGKPAPDLYLKALESLRCQSYQAFAIEDSENGIKAAQGAGVEVHQFSPPMSLSDFIVQLPTASLSIIDGDLKLQLSKVPYLPAADPQSDFYSEVMAIWERELKIRPELHNGKILCLESLSGNTCHVRETDYMHFLAQRRSANLRQKFRIKTLAVSGLLTCDNKILFGLRSPKVTQSPGYWELAPSGGLETVLIKDQLFAEMVEELGIPESQVLKAEAFAVIDDSSENILDIAIHVELKSSHLKLQRTEEYDEIVFVPQNEVHEFLGKHPVLEVSRKILIARGIINS